MMATYILSIHQSHIFTLQVAGTCHDGGRQGQRDVLVQGVLHRQREARRGPKRRRGPAAATCGEVSSLPNRQS